MAKHALTLTTYEVKRLRGRIANHIAKNLQMMEAEDPTSPETKLALQEWREILRKVIEAEENPI